MIVYYEKEIALLSVWQFLLWNVDFFPFFVCNALGIQKYIIHAMHKLDSIPFYIPIYTLF